MFEALVVGAGVLFGLAFLALVAKFVLGLVLLPFQIGFFIVKGLLLLVFAAPLILISLVVAACVLPVVFAFIGVPILALIAVVVLLVKLIH
jgi:hypothetical protein